MRKFLIGVGLLIALGCIGAGLYLWRDNQRKGIADMANYEASKQEERDHSEVVWCGDREYRCFADEADCASRKAGKCSRTTAYACFGGTSITTKEWNKWCFANYGGCTAARHTLMGFGDFRDVSECLVYRSLQ